MTFKTIQHKIFLIMILCIFTFSIINSEKICLAGEAFLIAESNRCDATAYSNGRRLARLTDDNRIVVYQDSMDNQSYVMFSVSNDGITWTEPAIVDSGSYPSVISPSDDVPPIGYQVVYVSADGKGLYLTWIYKDGEQISRRHRSIKPENALSCKYPVIEFSYPYIQIVWQQKSLNETSENIYLSLPGLSDSLFKLSEDDCDSRFPVIAGDLEYNPGLMPIIWTDYPKSGAPSKIVWRFYDEDYTIWYARDSIPLSPPEILPSSNGKTNPSISVRKVNHGLSFRQNIVAAYGRPSGGLTIYRELRGELRWSDLDSIETDPNPMPSVDDIKPFPEISCAIVWQDKGNIYYGQTDNARIVTSPPILVSEDDSIPKMFPNICYKIYRADSFDVVWTEGSAPPYRVMYRRMAKVYPTSLKRSIKLVPEKFTLSQNYPNPFNPSTIIEYALPKPEHVTISVYNTLGQMIETIVNKSTPAGHHEVEFNGQNFSSGVYFYRIKVGKFLQVRKMVLLR